LAQEKQDYQVAKFHYSIVYSPQFYLNKKQTNNYCLSRTNTNRNTTKRYELQL